MIKQIFVAECDICGATQRALQQTGRYNETDYALPQGWEKSETNGKFCICPACWRKLTRHERNGEG